ncbi:hypothetical protein CXB51_025427 [Gossypium anomalum]|uniref:Uncharacterized protein n=1 Tax=Gossypium anomalum TaxID=47600 RepID=A0A8J5YCG5_9ROSI|nr:hypothetical protein CXB51_025427 [Gossypium anomalum]
MECKDIPERFTIRTVSPHLPDDKPVSPYCDDFTRTEIKPTSGNLLEETKYCFSSIASSCIHDIPTTCFSHLTTFFFFFIIKLVDIKDNLTKNWPNLYVKKNEEIPNHLEFGNIYGNMECEKMQKRQILVVAVVLAGVSLVVSDEDVKPLDFYKYSLQWGPTVCLHPPPGKKCEGRAEVRFTIHGLWPQYYKDTPVPPYHEDPRCTNTKPTSANAVKVSNPFCFQFLYVLHTSVGYRDITFCN